MPAMLEIFLRVPNEKACWFHDRNDWTKPVTLKGASFEMSPDLDNWPKTVGDISSTNLYHYVFKYHGGPGAVGSIFSLILDLRLTPSNCRRSFLGRRYILLLFQTRTLELEIQNCIQYVPVSFIAELIL